METEQSGKKSPVSTEGIKAGLFLENRSTQNYAIEHLLRMWVIGPDKEVLLSNIETLFRVYYISTAICFATSNNS